MNRNEIIIRDVAKAAATVLAGLAALKVINAPALTKKARKKEKLRGVKRTGPNKTQLMLNVLKDGKPHPVTLLALAGGTTSGHVATHLKKRIDRGEIRRTKPGVFQIVVGRKRAAA